MITVSPEGKNMELAKATQDDWSWFASIPQSSYDCRERKEMTLTKKCTCKSECQDEKYGKGMRIHNLCVPTSKGQECRCVVCNTKKPA